MKTALFVDFDNVYSGLRRISTLGADRLARQPAKWLQWLTDNLPTTVSESEAIRNRRVLVRRCYLNPVMFNQFRRPFHEAGFEIVDCPPTTASGKTSTDIHLVLDTIDALQDATHFDEFVVFSADADFSPLLRRLRRHDRRTIIFAAGAMSESYKAAADAVIDISTFIREALQLIEDEIDIETDQVVGNSMPSLRMVELRKKAEGSIRRLVLDAADPVPLPRLAQQLQREIPGLKESMWAEAGSFSNLIRQLSPAGVQFDFKDEMAFDIVRKEQANFRQPSSALITSTPAEKNRAPNNSLSAEMQELLPISSDQIDEAAVRMIRQWIGAATRPMLFSTLGTELRKALPQLADGWNGAPTLAAYLQRLPLEPLMRGSLEDGSTFVLYDPEQHQAPAGVVGDSMVSAMLRAAELPVIRAQDFVRILHQARVHMGQQEPFEIAAVSRKVSESLGAENRHIPIKRITATLQALIFGGLDTTQAFSSPQALVTAAMGVILASWSRETQVQTDDEARNRLISWLTRTSPSTANEK
ncbi:MULTISPECIES: NYN domain-containing protein [Delftia]|uniref:NYN domain-containing protein n=2 Tax=Delftia TaxID=80865 RepID=A0ABW5EPX6_9BURK|nr:MULTISPECIES: NYN domain-containing protein [Delftia]OWG17677.1 NYN domain protein [Delftia sp. K82]TDF22966.1 NYN domain-containing protein [Delftia tsuruhatensis]